MNKPNKHDKLTVDLAIELKHRFQLDIPAFDLFHHYKELSFGEANDKIVDALRNNSLNIPPTTKAGDNKKPKTNSKEELIQWMKASVAKYKPFKPFDFADLQASVKSPMTIRQIAEEMEGIWSQSMARAICFRAVIDPFCPIDVATPSINSNIYAEAETNGSRYVFFPRNWRRQNVLKLQPPSPSLEEEMQSRGDNEDARFDIAIREPTGRERLSNACVAYMQTTGRVAYYLDHVLKVDINGLTVEFRSSPGESLRIMKALHRGIKK